MLALRCRVRCAHDCIGPGATAASETPFADLTRRRCSKRSTRSASSATRSIQLNSYENRVFQVFLESGEVVVPKFYRPGRWSDAQILEEHSFSAELAAREIPVIAPLVLAISEPLREPVTLSGEPPTLAHVLGQRVSVSPRRSGRAPELEDAGTLEWIGRFIGRMHAVGATRRFEHRWTLDIATFGTGARDYLIAHDWIPPEVLPGWRAAIDNALGEVQRAFDALPELRTLRLHGDCHLGNILWSDAGPHFVDLDDCADRPRDPGPVDAAVGRPREHDAPASAPCCAGYEDVHGLRLARTAPCRAAAHAAPDPPQRVARTALERPGIPASRSRGSRAAPTGASRRRS